MTKPESTLPQRQRIGLAVINKDREAELEARRDLAFARIRNEITSQRQVLGAVYDTDLTPEQREILRDLLRLV